MRSTRPRRSVVVTPVALIALAAAMPVMLAGEAVGFGGVRPSRSLVAGVSQERAENFVRYVSEAAKRLCGWQAAALPTHPPLFTAAPPQPISSLATPDDVSRSCPPLIAFLIDLPPPTL